MYFRLVGEKPNIDKDDVMWSFIEELEQIEHDNEMAKLDPAVLLLTDAKDLIEKSWKHDTIDNYNEPGWSLESAIVTAHEEYCDEPVETCRMFERVRDLIETVICDSPGDFND